MHVQVGLAASNAKGRLEPSHTGAFLAALPLALESCLLLARGGLAGHVWEASLLAALMNTTPYPIKQPFGEGAMKFVKQYYYGPDSPAGALTGPEAAADWAAMIGDEQAHGYLSKAAAGAGLFGGYGLGGGEQGSSGRLRVDRTVQLLANLAAFEAWQQQWCDVQRLKQLMQFDAAPAGSSSNGAASAAAESGGEAAADARNVLSSAAAAIVSDAEVSWCSQHHLIPSSLRHVQDTLNIILAGEATAGADLQRLSPPPEWHHCQHVSDERSPMQLSALQRSAVELV
jgi:hypothetical protein